MSRVTDEDLLAAFEAGRAEFERMRRMAEQSMPVLIERRSDGYQHIMLVALNFNVAPLLEGDWFAPKVPNHAEIA